MLIATAVVLKNRRSVSAKLFVLLVFALIGWSLTTYLSLHTGSDQETLFWIRWIMFFVVLQNTTLYLLVPLFPDASGTALGSTKVKLVVGYSVIVALVAISPYLFAGFHNGSLQPGFGMALFLPHAIFVGFFSLVRLARRIKKISGIRRTQLQYFFAGTISMVTLEPLCNFVLPVVFNSNFLVRFSPVYIVIFSGLIGYAMVRKKLFDIKFAAVRTIVYGATLVTLAGVYYLTAYIISIAFLQKDADLSVNSSMQAIGTAVILAFLFQPIKRFFDRVTDDIFYHDTYETDELFAQLSELLTSTTDLRGLLGRASNEIASTFKASQAFFFLYYTNATDHHMSAGTHGHAKLPVHDAMLLNEYVVKMQGDVLLIDALEDESPIRRMLASHRIGLVVPLRRGDDMLIGYIMLGDHQSASYSNRDTTILSTISNQLVIAIQNALSIHEVKELNATLQQRIDVATNELRLSNAQLKHLDETKDEFISMASHQLRTPLTSIKGYISMVLEGDAGKTTSQQEKLLTEAFNSSERMVRLIADFLNVSRLQTGKFTIEKIPCDMKELVRQEAGDLELIARTHNMKLRTEITHKSLPVLADEAKIRQVVMNFIDNAIYYSRPNSTIIVKLEEADGAVIFTVVDTGIGVPKAEQAKLFTRFFRANNARKQRPDGTGVGLYLARKVVHGHGGSIIFSSTEGKGSTFGFRLPIERAD